MENINRNSLVIFGYSETLTLCLFVNSKLHKVKDFNIFEGKNEDVFFNTVSDFISNKVCLDKVFYSCGPGGFTITRRILSFVKALKLNNHSNTKFMGLNHLFIFACYLNYKSKINDQGYILSILNHSTDNFVQIYQKKKNSFFFLDILSDVISIDLDFIEIFLENYNLSLENVNSIYLGSNPSSVSSFNNIQLVDRSNIIEIITKLFDLIENNKINKADSKYFFEEQFNPIYGKLPSTN